MTAVDPLAVLASLYDGLPTGFDTPETERQALDAATVSGASVYGEIMADGARRLLDWLKPGADDVFVDLGCGTGRLVHQAALTTAVGRAIGVELSAHRIAIAHQAQQRLRAAQPGTAARIDWRHEDIATTSLEPATLLYAGCFPADLAPVLGRCARRCTALRRLVTIRELGEPNALGLEAIGRLQLAMTFGPRVQAHAYRPRR